MKLVLRSFPENYLEAAPPGDSSLYLIGSPFTDEGQLRVCSWYQRLVEGLDRSDEQFMEMLQGVAGSVNFHFAMVIRKGDTWFLVSDIIRSRPLLYGDTGSGPFITDHLLDYRDAHGHAGFDPGRMEELVVFGNVTGHHTVYQGVYGLQAGEVVCLNGGHVRRVRYYRHVPPGEPMSYDSLDDITERFDRVFTRVFQRMFRDHPGVNRWVIPLSGGHDSRVIVNYLYRMGIKNVVCFTYGIPGNEQSVLSEKVAGAAGYPWHFVEYTDLKWKGLHDSGLLERYLRFAFNGTSTPHLQDLLAVHELKQKGILESGDVVVPGHGLDINAGYFLERADLACDNMEDAVRRACLAQLNLKQCAHAVIGAVRDIYMEGQAPPQAFREYLNWQERETKFIVNSLRVYDFLGFRCCVPFWDRELVDFCLALPPEDRFKRGLFLDAEMHGLLVDAIRQVPFVVDLGDKMEPLIKRMVKKVVPPGLMSRIVRLTGRGEVVNEGLHRIYTLQADSVEELLNPLRDFPPRVRRHFRHLRKRYTYQVDFHLLTALYTLRKAIY